MKKILFAILLSISIPLFSIDYQNALQQSLLYSPALKISAGNYQIRKCEAYENCQYPNPIFSFEVQHYSKSWDNDITYSISQLIEWHEKRAARRSIANSAKEVAAWEYKAAEHKLVRDLTIAFIEAYKAKEELDLATEKAKLCEELVAITNKKVEAGKANESIHLARAKIICHQSSIERRRALNRYEECKRILAAFWGACSIDFDLEFTLPQVYCPPPLCQLLPYLESSPEIAKSREIILGSLQNKNLQKVNIYPDIVVNAGYSRAGDDNNGYIFGLDIPIPLFNQNKGNICRAEWDYYKAEKESELIYAALENELKGLYAKWQDAYEAAQVYQNEIIPNLNKTCHASLEAYRIGKIDLEQVLQTQESCFDIETQYLEVISQYYILEATILQLLGRNHE